MRKFLTLLLAGLFVAGLTVSVQAAELKTSGFYRVGFDMQDNMTDFSDLSGADNSVSFIQQRFGFSMAWVTDKDLKAVVNFELDNGFGLFGGEPTAAQLAVGHGGSMGQFGTDDNAAFEVKEAYMEFLIPGTPVTAKIGPQSYFIGQYQNFLYRDAAGITLTMPVKPFSLSAFTYKIREGVTFGADDTDMYGLWFRGTTAGINLQTWGMFQKQNSPTAAFVLGPASVPGARFDGIIVTSDALSIAFGNPVTPRGAIRKADFMWLGASGETKFGPWSIFGNAIWSNVEADLFPVVGAASDFSASGLLLDAILSYQLGNIKLEGEALWTSEIDVRKQEPDIFFAPSTETGFFWGRGLVFFSPLWDYASGTTRNNDSPGQGLWFLRAAGTMKVSDKLSTTLNFLWIADNVKNGDLRPGTFGTTPATFAINGDDDTIGQEVDLMFKYSIYKNLALDGGVGWLFADKALDGFDPVTGLRRAADDALVAAARLFYSF